MVHGETTVKVHQPTERFDEIIAFRMRTKGGFDNELLGQKRTGMVF
jgi:hypothetical protein